MQYGPELHHLLDNLIDERDYKERIDHGVRDILQIPVKPLLDSKPGDQELESFVQILLHFESNQNRTSEDYKDAHRALICLAPELFFFYFKSK